MTDVADVISALAGTIGNDRGGKTIINDLLKVHLAEYLPPFEADDNTQRVIVFRNTKSYSLRLLSCQFVPDVAVTASDTNYTIMRVYHVVTPASGTDKLAAAAQTTVTAGTGNMTAETPYSLTLSSTLANLVLAAGEYAVFFCDGATGGTGVDLPLGRFLATYEAV